MKNYLEVLRELVNTKRFSFKRVRIPVILDSCSGSKRTARGPQAPRQIALEFDPGAPAGGVMGREMRLFSLLIESYIDSAGALGVHSEYILYLWIGVRRV